MKESEGVIRHDIPIYNTYTDGRLADILQKAGIHKFAEDE